MNKFLKYIHGYVDRTGKRRYYYRRKGHRAVPLPSSYGSPAFMRAYNEASGVSLPPLLRKKRGRPKMAQPDAAQPLVGVYLLMLNGRIVYVGSSINMSQRVADHRKNGRPFDKAFYIAVSERERQELERVLIEAINPPQNRNGLSTTRVQAALLSESSG